MNPVNIGICGLGTVGYGSYCVLKKNQQEILRRLGRKLCVSHVATRDLSAEQKLELQTDQVKVATDAFAVANDPDVDIFLELIGGYDLARELVLQAIANGKHVVTANKALIAVHGNEIFAAAKAKKVTVAYEAAVAGGIPIIKALREGLASNQIQWLAGIINGTGNFILSEMGEKSRPFAEVLKEAQELGYAEADPTFDVEGIDAAHKLTILAAISFGTPLKFDHVYTEGISEVTPADIQYADELGYRIKHLGISRLTPDGLELRVHPTLISSEALLANVNGVMNAVMVNGNAVGSTLYYGAGAGAEPTASAIVADIIDVTRSINSGSSVPVLGFQDDSVKDIPVLDITATKCAFYLRIMVSDKVGVMADIAKILERNEISIEAIVQKEAGTTEKKAVPIIILSHEVVEVIMNKAIAEIESLPAVCADVARIRVDKLDS